MKRRGSVKEPRIQAKLDSKDKIGMSRAKEIEPWMELEAYCVKVRGNISWS